MRQQNDLARYRDLFTSFFKVGVFTFGGGYAMIPLIEHEIIDRRGWIAQQDFVDLLTLAQSVPGPIALNSAAFVGYQTRGYMGALVSVLGIVIPSFVIILLVALFFGAVRDNAVVEAAFKGMRPVVIALIVAPTISLMRGMSYKSMGVTLLTMALFAIFEFSPAIPIFGSIIVALVWTNLLRRKSTHLKR